MIQGLALTLDQARDMAQKAQNYQQVVQIAFTYRFVPASGTFLSEFVVLIGIFSFVVLSVMASAPIPYKNPLLVSHLRPSTF